MSIVGYTGHETLAELTGGDHLWRSELSVVKHSLRGQYPSDNGITLETTPPSRWLIIIEGKSDRIQPYLEAIAALATKETA